MGLSRRRLLLGSAIVAIGLMPGALEWMGVPLSFGLGGALGASTALVAWLLRGGSIDQATRSHRMVNALHRQYRQLEAWTSLLDYLKPRTMLPPTRGWAATPDLLRLLCQQVESRKPDRILELGSGVSTLILAYCLQRRGSGQLLSLEHDPETAARTNRWLARHRLDGTAEVRHTPLVSIRIAGEDWLWYDVSQLETPSPIDLLFVDGPPGNLRALARYPALPILAPMLAKDVTIVLDDAKRADEAQIGQRWCQENPELEVEYQDLEKGALVFRSIASNQREKLA